MGKLFKWMAGWKLAKAIFRTGEAKGHAEPRRRGFGAGRGFNRPGRRL